MRIFFALSFTILGVVLLALDRILDKPKVIAFDGKLADIANRFQPLKAKYLNIAIVSTAIFVCLYFAIRTSLDALAFYYNNTSPFVDTLVSIPTIIFLGGVVVVIALIWVIEGAIMGAWMKHKGESQLTLRGALILGAVIAPIGLFSLIIFSCLKLSLYPLIYPFKGILILNNRWFNSFSGVIGLILAVIGTILQFL